MDRDGIDVYKLAKTEAKERRLNNAILPPRVANHSTGFGSPCLLTEKAI